MGGSASQASWISPSGNQSLNAGYFSSWTSGDSNDAYFENTNSKIFLSEVFEQNKFCLSEKELMILNKSILKEQTLSQIGSDFGISAERVRQIKKGSLNQIKESIKFRSIA